MSISRSRRQEIERVKTLSEQLLQKKLTFVQYSNHMVFAGRDVVVKCSDEALDYEMEVARYCRRHGVAALTERADLTYGGYGFYVYQKGEDTIDHDDLTRFLGSSLAKLHQLKIPNTPVLKTHAQELALCMQDWKAGYDLLSPSTIKHIKHFVQLALELPGQSLTHGDPTYSNVVRIDSKRYLIDWEHASVGPKELDLAVVKYIECFGEPTKSFEKIAAAYGPYDETRLEILLNCRVASSLLWYAHNVIEGHFERTDEIETRSDWLSGDRSIKFTKAVS